MAPKNLHRARSSARAFARSALVLAACALGCGESEVPVQGIAHPTLIQVSPREFLGEVPCLDAPGAMRRYVATIFDVHYSDAGAPEADSDCDAGTAPPESAQPEFALPSSTIDRGDGVAVPVPCTQIVGFSHVVAKHTYRAEIDGYDRDDLVALAPGLRTLSDPATGERVPPRWKGRCGDCLPAEAFNSAARTVGACSALADSAPPGETLVEVSIDQALGGLECGSDPGSVDRFEVELRSGEVLGAPCGESVTLMGRDLERSTVTLPVHAFEAGASTPTWGTQCVADVVLGVTTSATCLPLASTGALEVDPEAALEALGLACDASSFTELEVEMTEGNPDLRVVDPGSCSRALDFLGRAPGPATARATARLEGGMSAHALCTGSVVPGSTVSATCTKDP